MYSSVFLLLCVCLHIHKRRKNNVLSQNEWFKASSGPEVKHAAADLESQVRACNNSQKNAVSI